MGGNSNVGTRGIYEDGDQRNVKKEEIEQATRHNVDNLLAHKANDSKDQRSIANRLAAEEGKTGENDPNEIQKKDPTAPARLHGNEPSRGAKIDAELQAEDEQRIREKDGK